MTSGISFQKTKRHRIVDRKKSWLLETLIGLLPDTYNTAMKNSSFQVNHTTIYHILASTFRTRNEYSKGHVKNRKTGRLGRIRSFPTINFYIFYPTLLEYGIHNELFIFCWACRKLKYNYPVLICDWCSSSWG